MYRDRLANAVCIQRKIQSIWVRVHYKGGFIFCYIFILKVTMKTKLNITRNLSILPRVNIKKKLVSKFNLAKFKDGLAIWAPILENRITKSLSKEPAVLTDFSALNKGF